jgi:hypothetical protein
MLILPCSAMMLPCFAELCHATPRYCHALPYRIPPTLQCELLILKCNSIRSGTSHHSVFTYTTCNVLGLCKRLVRCILLIWLTEPYQIPWLVAQPFRSYIGAKNAYTFVRKSPILAPRLGRSTHEAAARMRTLVRARASCTGAWDARARS